MNHRQDYFKRNRLSERGRRRQLWKGNRPPVRMSFALPVTLSNKLDRIAKRNKMSQGEVIRALIHHGLKATGGRL